MDFKVGQRVVCVNNEGVAKPSLEKGKTYTIVDINSGISGPPNIFLFVDAANPGGWFPYRFKPLEERKTDISVFTKLLKPVKEKEPV